MRVYEIEYRPTASADEEPAEWRRMVERPPESSTGIVIPDLVIGIQYDVRTRLVDLETGAESPWFSWPPVEVERPDGTPPAPTSVRTTKNDCLTWEMPHEVADLRGFIVRHAPGGHEGWERAEPAHEGIVEAPPLTLCRVPKGIRTFLVRAVDWDGNESEETILIVDRGPIDDQAEFRDIRRVDESALGFTGSIQGATAGGATLTASALGGTAPLWAAQIEPMFSVDGDTPVFGSDPDGPLFGQIWLDAARAFARNGAASLFGTYYQWIEYVWSVTVHCGEEGPRSTLTVDASVSAEGWRIEYRLHEPDPCWPINPHDAMFSATPSDPIFTTQSPKPWRPWPGRLNPVAVGQYDFRLIVPGGYEAAVVSGLAVTISSEARVRHVQALAVPALGGTRASPGEEWRRIAEVRTVAATTGTPVEVGVTSRSRAKGPALRTYVSGVETTTLLDVTIRGY
jgi:hypothetical protein